MKLILAAILAATAVNAWATVNYHGRFDPQGSANVANPYPVAKDEGLGAGTGAQ